MKIITAPTGVRFAKLTKAEVEAIAIDNLAIIAVMRDGGELTSVECEALARINTLFRPLDVPAATIDRTIQASEALGLTPSKLLAPMTRGKTYERYIGLDQQQRHVLRRFKHVEWFEEVLSASGIAIDPVLFEMKDWMNAPKADSPELIEVQRLHRQAAAAKTAKARKADAARTVEATEKAKDTTPNAAFLREKRNIVLTDGIVQAHRQAQDLWKEKTALHTKVQEHIAAHMETQGILDARDIEVSELKDEIAQKDAEIVKLSAQLNDKDADHERERRIMVRATNTACQLAVELGIDTDQILETIEDFSRDTFSSSRLASADHRRGSYPRHGGGVPNGEGCTRREDVSASVGTHAT